MAFTLGASLLSSSYQMANNLPNMLYELVVGGMLVTAFLPVYVSIKNQSGKRAGNEYASNLLTIVVVFLGILSALCIMFPGVAIYTQSFFSDQGNMGQATFFFQFFAIQIVFYGASTIVSGLLNANHDYLWSSIAPVANNVIVIASFVLYALIAPYHEPLAMVVLAVGNPLGVFVQMAMQISALKRYGIHLRPKINFHDPALRDTMAIGLPTVVVAITSYITVSVQTAASLVFTDAGPSVMMYARLWFTLPYSFLVVPITTTMFTELSEMKARDNMEGVKRGITTGVNQILFFTIPFMLYLVVFAYPLVSLLCVGAFTMESVGIIAAYLVVLSFALPFYGVKMYLQKVFSSLRIMGVYAGINIVATIVQVAFTVAGALLVSYGVDVNSVAAGEVLFFVFADVCLFIVLRRTIGSFGFASTIRTCISSLVLGLIGALAGAGVLWALQTFAGPLSGSLLQSLLYVVLGGIVSLLVTFGAALALKVPESSMLASILSRLTRKSRRA
ncbi:MAG TPA: murein biosynthesis integral membrane protein MurJ [Candidatus Aphodovivens excrementavium]|nr:murein biosynthesis integral membrane protein MurJ [Candidatus Aphodovivens excrementavium]